MSEAVDKPKLPTLRFPEFEGEWRAVRLVDLEPFEHGDGDWILSENISASGKYQIVQLGNIGFGEFVTKPMKRISELDFANVKGTPIKKGDLLINRMVDENLYCCIQPYDGDYVTAVDVCWIRNSKKFTNEFLMYQMLVRNNQSRLLALSSGSGRVRISKNILFNEFSFNMPEGVEQAKIVTFIGGLENRIQLVGQQREALTAYKKGMMQRLFSQELRFTRDDGSPFPAWQEKRLADVLTEHKERSSGAERVHSVSVHKGVIDQVEHLGRSFAAANTDHYGLVKPGDVIYTKSPTGDFPFGIIKQSRLSENVIVSPLYGVFTPETYALGYILNEHFCSVINTHNYLHRLVQKGAKNTINITNAGFLEGRLTLPVDHDEQQKIADFLSALDAKIDAVARQIDAMQRFKKGLLQQMFV